LTLLARDHHVVIRDQAGLLEPISRQRLLDFDGELMASESERRGSGETERRRDGETEKDEIDAVSTGSPRLPFSPSPLLPVSAADWLERGSHLLEEGRIADAVEAFRCALMCEPSNPETHFHLAEALYRSGNLAGACERFHVAVELDHQYLEAWTQLGCVAAELEQSQAALDAFEIALQSHADYPDAHFHKAELLHRLNRDSEAIPHWQAFLTHNQRGPWADVARKRLESGAHQIAGISG
jgi:tetratricopeptide (TPR) repeat protein